MNTIISISLYFDTQVLSDVKCVSKVYMAESGLITSIYDSVLSEKKTAYTETKLVSGECVQLQVTFSISAVHSLCY